MNSKAPEHFIQNAAHNLALSFHSLDEMSHSVANIKSVCKEFEWDYESTMGQVRTLMCKYLKS